jgi:hypothetical protein
VATLTKTFTFDTNLEGFVGYPAVTFTCAWLYGALMTYAKEDGGRGTGYWEWSGTWEELGVPAGATVTAIRLDGYQRACSYYDGAYDCIDGPWELRNSSGTLLASLKGQYGFRSAFDWTAGGSSPDQSVPAGSQASGSAIKLRIYVTLDSDAYPSGVNLFYDNISYVITYNLLQPVNVSVPAGALALSGVVPTLTSRIAVPAGALALAGGVPALTRGIAVPAGVLALSGGVPDVVLRAMTVIDVPAGALLLTGAAPEIFETQDYYVAVPAGELVLAGAAPALMLALSVPPGALVLTGAAPEVKRAFPRITGLRVMRWGGAR